MDTDIERSSAEALPENSSLLNFKAFAREYPEKLFPLLEKLRPEFQEIFIEYYVLEKFQNFMGKVHGCVHTRIWQQLRIIEQAIGSLIILGTNPDTDILQPILDKAGLDGTPYGSLTRMILLYAQSQNYALVAKEVGAPVPAIRKIFRPAITMLLADKDVHAVAVGAYLRNLTHHASLTKAGLSKRCIARTQRIKTMRFHAEPIEESPLLSFGKVDSLHDTPWMMLELSPEERMAHILLVLPDHLKRICGRKQAVQVFAPIDVNGDLKFGYIFARATKPSLVRALMKIRGIAELVSRTQDEEEFAQIVTIPNAEIQALLYKENPPSVVKYHLGDFVQILTGEAKNYCGQIIKTQKTKQIVQVDFPTGRQFIIDAASGSLLKLDIPVQQRAFWGKKYEANLSN